MVGPRSMLGSSAIIKITSVGRWSVFGEVIEVLTQNNRDRNYVKGSPCSNSQENCACSKEPESCACSDSTCCQTVSQNTEITRQVDKQNTNLIGWLLRKRKNHLHKKEAETVLHESKEIQGVSPSHTTTTLSSGIIFGLLTAIALLLFLGFMNLSSN